jgi:hypothetical protein
MEYMPAAPAICEIRFNCLKDLPRLVVATASVVPLIHKEMQEKY